MPYNFAADGKKLLWQTFFEISALLDGKRPFCVSEPASGAYGQLTVFILDSLEACSSGLPSGNILIFSLGVTAVRRYERKSIENRRIFQWTESVWPKFQLQGLSHTNHSSCQKNYM